MMKDIKRIIIPVDNSEDSKKAVKHGAFLANLLGIGAKIITINDTHQFMSSVVLEEKIKKEVNVFLENFKKIAEEYKIKIETQLIVGKPSEEIVKYAKENDLIVMAHHDRTRGFDKVMEKSVSREVVNHAPCSVLVIK